MSRGYNTGGRSIFYAEPVGRGGKVSNTFEVLIEREATLSVRLDDIEERTLRAITVLIHPGFDDVRVVALDRDDALKLYHLLGDALMATDEGGAK